MLCCNALWQGDRDKLHLPFPPLRLCHTRTWEQNFPFASHGLPCIYQVWFFGKYDAPWLSIPCMAEQCSATLGGEYSCGAGMLPMWNRTLSSVVNFYYSLRGTTLSWMMGTGLNRLAEGEDVWLLGKCYHFDKHSEVSTTNMLRALQTVPWFTYRKRFEAIPTSSYTTDAGWGCMMRTGQMLLAYVFLRHYLSGDWRYDENEEENFLHCRIMSWFCDTSLAPYSIHNICLAGQEHGGVKVGTWFAPSTLSHVIKRLVQHNNSQLHFDQFHVYVGQHATIYKEEVERTCSHAPAGSSGKTPPATDPDTSVPQDQSASKDLPFSPGTPQSDKNTPATVNPDTGILQDQSTSKDLPHSPGTPQSETSEGSVLCIPSSVPDLPTDCRSDSFDDNDSTAPLKPVELTDFSSISSAQNTPGSSNTTSHEAGQWSPVVIMVPVMLGLREINSLYFSVLLQCFQFPQFVGVVGGKHRYSLYFVGTQGDNLIYLDPHLEVRAAMLSTTSRASEHLHTHAVRMLNITNLDPSMVINFYCRTREDFEDFVQRAEELAKSTDNPIFNVY